MYSAAFDWVGPVAIRYPRGAGSVVEWQQPMQSYPHGRARVLSEGSSLAILSLGPIGVSASHVVERLQAEGYSVAHIDLVFAKPLDEACLRAVFASTQKILTIEEGCLNGGVGSAILQLAMQEDYAGRIKTLHTAWYPSGAEALLRTRRRVDLPSSEATPSPLVLLDKG